MKKGKNNYTGKLLGTALTAGMLMFGTASYAQVGTGTGTQTDQGTTTQQQRENVGNTEYDDDFDRFDETRGADSDIDRAEFDRRMDERGTFDDWDVDRDGTINENEFNEGVRTRQEGVGTGTTGTTETTGTTDTQDTDYGIYQDWDTNRDGSLDEDEFREGTFNTWDRNREGIDGTQGTGTQGTGTGTGIDDGGIDDGGIDK